jgi:2-iminoacetate synthase
MSAESKTFPGAYSNSQASEKQFQVADTRSLAEVCSAIKGKGYDPVFKDWDRSYIPA